jgi:hypothetical protein
VPAGDAEADDPDLEPFGGAQEGGGGDDGVVHADVLGVPDTVETRFLGGLDDRQVGADGAEPGETHTQTHNDLLLLLINSC